MRKMLVLIAVAGLFLAATTSANAEALVVTAAIGRQDQKVKSNGYDSPQEAGEAFIAAMTKKDWKTGFRCFTSQAQDLAVVHLITTTRMVAVLRHREQEVEALFKKHGFDVEAAKTVLQSAKSKANQTKPDYKKAVKSYVDQIEDKEVFFTNMLTWLDRNFGSGLKPGTCELQDLKTTQDTATGKLKLTRPAYSVDFRKHDGRWFMALPEKQYRPSSWHSVFLSDFLDALHHWKL